MPLCLGCFCEDWWYCYTCPYAEECEEYTYWYFDDYYDDYYEF